MSADFNNVPGRKNFGPDHALVTTPQPCVMIATWDKDHNPPPGTKTTTLM